MLRACRRVWTPQATCARSSTRIVRSGIQSHRRRRGCSTLAASGSEITDYHLEAAIAWVHTTAHRAEDTDWGTIVSLYDQLMAMRPSPVVALNRAIAVAQRDGPERGLEEMHAIAVGRAPRQLSLLPCRAGRA